MMAVETTTLFVNGANSVAVFRNEKGNLTIQDEGSEEENPYASFLIIEWTDVPAFIAEIQRIYGKEGGD